MIDAGNGTLDGEGPVVLVVDDEVMFRRLVVRGLESIQCREILEAANGEEARKVLAGRPADCPIDIVITDVLMPGLDGLGLMRWAKEHCAGPVWIILSGADTFDTAVEAIQLGAFDFIAKPPDLRMLEVSIRNAWNNQLLVREREKLHESLEERVRQLERLCMILEDQAETIRQDLRRAETIQSALLPGRPPDVAGFRVDTLYRPGHNVGGDLYDVAKVGEHHLVAYIADATGHGVSAAMLSVLFKQRLRMVEEGNGKPLPPARVLEAANRALLEDVGAPGMFITAIYCVLDTASGDMTVASAGHPPFIVARSDGTFLDNARTGPALGLYRDAKFGEKTLKLERHDRFLLYTDGLTDGGVSFDRLKASLRGGKTSGRELLAALFDEASASGSAGERDDVTLVCVERGDGPSTFDNGGAAAPEPAAAAAPAAAMTVLHGESDDFAYLSISGRGTYKHCPRFHAAARALLDARRPVTVDLSACEYLDSTLLGTLHDLVDSAGSAGSEIRLQGVNVAVRNLFEELSMDLVLDHITNDPVEPLPRMRPLDESGDGGNVDERLMLRAHEILLSLSESNREKFITVVEMMRNEIGRRAP